MKVRGGEWEGRIKPIRGVVSQEKKTKKQEEKGWKREKDGDKVEVD